MADSRHADLMRQGFMKPPKKRRGPAKSKEEHAAEITRKTGIHVWVDGNVYKITRPDGIVIYPGASKAQTLQVARLAQKEFEG